jgi:hypothetical protein
MPPQDHKVSLCETASRRLALSPGGLYELLMEFYDVGTWAAAVAEILEAPDSPRHPVAAFATTRVWL